MHTTTKGALAAGAAAVLLLGGAGSLAYWTDSATVNGGSISSGSLDLTAGSCAAGWTYVGGGTVTTIVPGDTVEKECTFTVGAVGDHLQAQPTVPSTVAFTPPASGTLSLPVSATYELNAAPLVGNVTEANNGQTLTATIQVDFPFGTAATVNANDTQGFTKTLDALTVTLTQVDETP